MADPDFNFDIHLYKIVNPEEFDELSDDNIFLNLMETIEKYNTEENIVATYNTVTSYFNGDFNSSHTKRAVGELCELCDMCGFGKLDELGEGKKLQEFIQNWGKHMSETMERGEIYYVLKNILSNSTPKSYNLTKLIWSVPIFRKLINLFPRYDTGESIVDNGIFRTLFATKPSNYKTSLSLDSVSSLIDDITIYPELIHYIHHIIKLNEPYCAINFIAQIKQKKCSSLDFNIFVLKLIYQMYNKYFDSDEKKNLLMRDIEITEYSIEKLDLPQQIYVTMLYGMHVLLESVFKIYDMNRKYKDIPSVRIIRKIINEDWIQKVFIEYANYHQFLHIEETLNDMLHFFDFIMAYNKKDKLGIQINDKIYKITSDILGGMNGEINNVHIRRSAFTIIKTSASEYGFLVFDDFFNNLFKYVNEISIVQLALPTPGDQITHQHSITMVLKQMIDLSHKIEGNSKYIFAETLYRLISNSLELFDHFDSDLYDKIKGKVSLERYYHTCYGMMLETSIYTLLIYRDIYERKMIETVYPEIENKYINLVGRIIKNIKMSEENGFKLNKDIEGDNNLISICFDIIKSKIDSEIDLIIEIKKEILNTIDDVNIDDQDAQNIKNKLNDYQEDMTDYPDELLDQIMCKLISTPVMIPNNNEIFEKSSIVTIIYEKLPNPYTREDLTLEILEKYNREEHVIQKIQEFNDYKSEWFAKNKN